MRTGRALEIVWQTSARQCPQMLVLKWSEVKKMGRTGDASRKLASTRAILALREGLDSPQR